MLNECVLSLHENLGVGGVGGRPGESVFAMACCALVRGQRWLSLLFCYDLDEGVCVVRQWSYLVTLLFSVCSCVRGVVLRHVLWLPCGLAVVCSHDHLSCSRTPIMFLETIECRPGI